MSGSPELQPVSRRRVIGLGATALGLAGAYAVGNGILGPDDNVVAPPPSQPAAKGGSGPVTDYTRRETYDRAEQLFRSSPAGGLEPPDASTLAWSESRALLSYLVMYEATADATYLDTFVATSERVLALRDDQVGHLDYRGRSRPCWSASYPYTVRHVDVLDTGGTPAIRLASSSPSSRVVIEVAPQSADMFTLVVRAEPDRPASVSRLSLDARSPQYVVRRLRIGFPDPASLIAINLRRNAFQTGSIAPVQGVELLPTRYTFAAHTGMIGAPLARFAGMVRADRDLHRRYGLVAARLSEGVATAVDLHDGEWKQVSSRKGGYAFEVGAPVRGDGTFLPHNQNLAMARCLTYLYRAIGDETYRLRAQHAVNLFLSDLGDAPTPTWSYHWTGNPAYHGYDVGEVASVHSPRMSPRGGIEDTSHGALDVAAAVAAFDNGTAIPFSLPPRLARTFFTAVVRRARTGHWVTARQLDSFDQAAEDKIAAAGWLDLARWDRRIYDVVGNIMLAQQPSPRHGQVLAAIAGLVRLR